MTPHCCASTPTKSISSPRLISEEFCSTRTTSRTDCAKALRITHHETRITPMKWFVAVSGNIDAGKSTVTTVLSEKLGWNHDRTTTEDAEILARNQRLQGLQD